MSAGLVTMQAGFKAVRVHAPILFWPLVTLYTTLGGLGLGLGAHYLDTRAVFWFVPLCTGALMWPVLVDMNLGKLRGTLASLLLAALMWWTQWIGWHLAEGARAEGPWAGTAWLAADAPSPSPYDFDSEAGVRSAVSFALMPPADWPAHFHALSEVKKLETPRRTRGGPERYLEPEDLRAAWIIEPFLLWSVMLLAIWYRPR